MKKKVPYNVLVVCGMKRAGKDFFMGILDAASDMSDVSLSTVRPGRFFGRDELMDADGRPFDGLIVSMPGTDDVMKRIARSHTPIVLVNITDPRLAARNDAISTVWTDNADIGRRAAQHLLDCRTYRSAGYVHELNYQFYSVERMMAFRETMKRNGLKTSTFPDDYPTPTHGARDQPNTILFHAPSDDFTAHLRKWVRELPKPAAVMATSDMRAADVINACKAEGIPVPSQVSVIGVDYDTLQHEKCGQSISSVNLNMYMMGRQAMKELVFLFRHPKWKGRVHEVLIPAKEVFAGESTSRSISAMRLVAKALAFIAANRMRRLKPSDVFTHLGCSRQLANLRFSQVGGMTIREAIEKARMEEVQKRIRSGERVSDIVKSMQFTSANQLYRIYKRHFGHTTRQTDQ